MKGYVGQYEEKGVQGKEAQTKENQGSREDERKQVGHNESGEEREEKGDNSKEEKWGKGKKNGLKLQSSKTNKPTYLT